MVQDRGRTQRLAAQMLDRERWPREQVLGYQRDRLREIVQYAVANSPYYREVIGDVAAGDMDLQRLPVLTKTRLMAAFDRIVTDPRLRLADAERHLAGKLAAEPLHGRYRIAASGGTTGELAVTAYDPSAWELAVASVLRALAIAGISAETRVLGIGSPSPRHITNRLFGELRSARSSSAPSLAVTTPLCDVTEALNAYQPEAVITYPSFIRCLAEEQQAGRLRIGPQKFFSVAETLAHDVRDLVHDTWGARVLNSYGATEAGLIGQECPWTMGMHVFEDLLVLEVVDDDYRPVPAGVVGRRLLITNLFNHVLPLIRYEISDLVAVAEGSCRCGRPHLRLASVQGRREEVLRLPARNGGHVEVHAGRLGGTLLRTAGIRQYQLIPRPPSGLMARVVLRDPSQAERILPSARHALKAELEQPGVALHAVKVDAVDEIERVGTGAKQKVVNASG
jgi:phenylacetate-CoA ligase